MSEKCLRVPHRQFVFTIPFQLRDYFRLCRKPLLNALFKSHVLITYRKRIAKCNIEKRTITWFFDPHEDDGIEDEEEIPLDIFSELFDPKIEENPALACPHCNRDLLVPRDVYDQMKGKFVYKPAKK